MKKYASFVYENYIKEDWDCTTKIGKITLKPAWFVRSIYVSIFAVVCFPIVLAHMKVLEMDFYKDFTKMVYNEK